MRELLGNAAERHPGLDAIVDEQRRYSYEAWEERVRKIGAALWELGVRRGDRVMQVLRNREEACALFFACQYIGAVYVPVNFRWTSGEIAYCLTDAEPRVVVYEPTTAKPIEEAVGRVGWRGELVVVEDGGEESEGVRRLNELVAGVRARPIDVSVDESDIAVMLYTSGTTGRPKGVLRSQRAEYAATVGQVIHHRLETRERTLGVMPLYHTMGLHTLTSMVAMNGLFVAMREWDVKAALELIEKEGVTYLYLVPTLYQMLVEEDEARQRAKSVRKVAWAGAPMLSSLVRRCSEVFRPTVFINHYGSTEVYIHSVYSEPCAKPGCAGKAAFHTSVRVVKADAEVRVRPDDIVRRGQTGEIVVRMGDDAFRGYHRREDATARAIRDGWYFTGDTGYVDEDGDVWVTGRVDDMIITGGENVYPVEVEEVLARHPKVKEVAVVGLPDERWGQIVAAFVVPKEPVSAEELDAFCLESKDLARFKRPRKYVFVGEIPRSSTGKVLRRLLVERGG